MLQTTYEAVSTNKQKQNVRNITTAEKQQLTIEHLNNLEYNAQVILVIWYIQNESTNNIKCSIIKFVNLKLLYMLVRHTITMQYWGRPVWTFVYYIIQFSPSPCKAFPFMLTRLSFWWWPKGRNMQRTKLDYIINKSSHRTVSILQQNLYIIYIRKLVVRLHNLFHLSYIGQWREK
jgi:hypothetical protein